MRKKNFKGRCEKRVIGKCTEVCRTYDAIQYAYADLLQASDEITEIKCNVLLEGLDIGEYISDFVCTKADGDLMVRVWLFGFDNRNPQLDIAGVVYLRVPIPGVPVEDGYFRRVRQLIA